MPLGLAELSGEDVGPVAGDTLEDFGGSFRRAMEMATQVISAAKSAARSRSDSMNATRPPTRAPAAENSSSVMPRRRLAT